MRIVVGMATTAERRGYAEKAIESLVNQVDHIHLYNNGAELEDLTDNGKFFGLTYEDEPCYYFSCDDDLIYPSDYVEKTIEAIEKHNCIITHHGRILRGENKPYYTGHIAFGCLGNSKNILPGVIRIDVAGTGVTAFKTSFFNPVDIWASEDKRMSDLVFSLEAAKQGKEIKIVPPVKGWIKQIDIPKELTIYHMEKDNKRQMEIANEIFRLPPC